MTSSSAGRARRGRDEVQVVQKGSEVFPHLEAALRRRSTELVLYGIPLFAAVVLRDFVAPAICVPPKVGGGAAVPRTHIRDVVWSDLTQLRQEGCTGHRVIGAACLPSWDSPANPCPWCRGHVGPVCASCNTVVHNRGSCRWNSGAHASYIASGDVNIRLCPDCWWVWASSLAAAPRRHPPPTLGANLLQHLRHSASHCIPGAGSGATAASSLLTRKVRRWLLRQLEGGDLISIGSLLQELRAWAPTVADDLPPVALTRAIRALSAEGRIVVRRDAVELLCPQS